MPKKKNQLEQIADLSWDKLGINSTNGPGAKLSLAAEVISIRTGYQAWP
jgi:hypothetical protein